MGQLKDLISQEIIKSMKAQEKERLNVLRYLKKLFIENDTSNKPIEESDIVIAHAKKIKDSLSLFPEGSDHYLAALRECEILKEFLPQQLTENDVEAIILNAVKQLESAQSTVAFGDVMKVISPLIKGKFDNKLAVDLVKKKLTGV
jgi:uncharacterized protein YqeY